MIYVYILERKKEGRVEEEQKVRKGRKKQVNQGRREVGGGGREVGGGGRLGGKFQKRGGFCKGREV